MLTVIAELHPPARTTARRFSDQFAKIIPTVCRRLLPWPAFPLVDHAAGVSFQTTAPDSIVMVEQWKASRILNHHRKPSRMKAWSEAVKAMLETSIRILRPAFKSADSVIP